MLDLGRRRQRITATINGRPIAVEPHETLLGAALRQGVEIPFSCLVGECCTCKCRLLDGRVRELTETGYLLTAEELANGTILACRSVPLGDVRIEVERASPEVAHSDRQELVVARRRGDAASPAALQSADRVAPRSAPDSAPASDSHDAGWLDYVKFLLFHVLGLASAVLLVAGGWVTTLGLYAWLALYVLCDTVCEDDVATPRYRHPGILTFQLWMALPLVTFVVFCAVWSVSAGDPLGFGAWAQRLSGVDLVAAKAASSPWHQLSAATLTGLMIGMLATIPAHELVHRTWDRRSMFVGRWLLAFSFDTAFSIEHVYGHHRLVGTADDPATAPRGRNAYVHILVSTIKGNISAWRIEAARLRRRRHAVLSWRSALLRGYGMSALLVAAAGAIGGWRAALFFVACALWAKALLEIVNYMEHYGLVRDPAGPVLPHHSWNSNRRVSSWSMFNLTRHSHHHVRADVPYHDLKPLPDAPQMIGGYLATILIAMIPPLWHRLMTPRVLQWDRELASEAERALAAAANVRSGIRGLVAAG